VEELKDGAGLILFAGRFGSGKTEAAINYALALVEGPGSRPWGEQHGGQGQLPKARSPVPGVQHAPPKRAILIDLDIVTPYFRSREVTETIRKEGVEVIAPSAVGQHLDTPAITPQILGAIQQQEQPVVIDVGGDRQGARALGQFSSAIRQRGYTMHFVVNPYRPFTDSLEGLTRSISEIESSARLRVSSLVSNPNLMGETTAEQILEGHARIEEFARRLKLPIAFVCLERHWVAQLGAERFAQPILALDRYFTMSWE
jgi:hypothetical protein